VANLFMAGRCVSVTHEALGSVRVMRTTAMMGEVVGMAAAVCKQYDTTPRGVYAEHLPQLQAIMTKGVGKLPPTTAATPSAGGKPAKLTPPEWIKTAGPNLARAAKIAVSSHLDERQYPAANLNDGQIDLARNAGRWVSQRTMPQHVELTWDAPQTISAARIVSGYYKGSVVDDAIQDFVLQAPEGAGWKDLPGAKAAGNTKVDWSAQFQPVTAGRLRLLITASPTDTARVWEIELYGASAAQRGLRPQPNCGLRIADCGFHRADADPGP
jgi:hypothetical protein